MGYGLCGRYGGYNPMGNRNPPQAGCPKQNIHRLLRDLTDAGFSVVRLALTLRAFQYRASRLRMPPPKHDNFLLSCSLGALTLHPSFPSLRYKIISQAVVEEHEDPEARYGVRPAGPKKRYISQVVSPARPNYLYGYINERSVSAIRRNKRLCGAITRPATAAALVSSCESSHRGTQQHTCPRGTGGQERVTDAVLRCSRWRCSPRPPCWASPARRAPTSSCISTRSCPPFPRSAASLRRPSTRACMRVVPRSPPPLAHASPPMGPCAPAAMLGAALDHAWRSAVLEVMSPLRLPRSAVGWAWLEDAAPAWALHSPCFQSGSSVTGTRALPPHSGNGSGATDDRPDLIPDCHLLRGPPPPGRGISCEPGGTGR